MKEMFPNPDDVPHLICLMALRADKNARGEVTMFWAKEVSGMSETGVTLCLAAQDRAGTILFQIYSVLDADVYPGFYQIIRYSFDVDTDAPWVRIAIALHGRCLPTQPKSKD
jgi:hypothetical protein